MKTEIRTVEIAGGGLAGLALAAALARAGWRVAVHEAAEELRSGGGGLYISRDGFWALDRIGQRSAFTAASHEPRGFETWINGRLHRSHINDGVFRTALRSSLHSLLVETARAAGAEVRTGARVSGASSDGALTFVDGTRRDADLVIAANGVNSDLHASLGLTRDRLTHDDGLVRVLLDRTQLSGADWEMSKDCWSYEHEALRILYTPCSPTHCYLVMMVSSDDAPRTSLPVKPDLWLPSFPILAPLLEQEPIEARVDRYGSIRLSSWVAGRAAIIGDAAHAMPSSHARGANISIRNAVELAEELLGNDDIDKALAAWQARMRPVVAADQVEAEYLARSRSLHRGFPDIDLDELVPTNMKAG